MNIFLISNMYPSKNNPSYGIFVKEFVKGVENNGVRIRNKVVIDKKTDNIFEKIYLYIIFYIKIIFKGIFCKYDIIYVHYIAHTSIPVLILSFLRKKKIVLNVHGDDILPRTSLVKSLQKVIKILLKRTNLVVLPSSFFVDIFLSNFDYPISNILISPSGGIDVKIFKPIPEGKKHIGINQEEFLLGYISRISFGKGWDLFIDAVEEISKEYTNITAIMIGNGEETTNLKNEIKKRKIKNIQFLENIPHEKLALYYSAFDLFIFPSKLKESLGLVGLEAMACGTPVIGSNIGGIPTYLKHNYNGLLFNQEDKYSLINSIKLFLSFSESEKIRLKNNSLKTAENYNSKLIMSKLYKKLETI